MPALPHEGQLLRRGAALSSQLPAPGWYADLQRDLQVEEQKLSDSLTYELSWSMIVRRAIHHLTAGTRVLQDA